MSDIGVIGAGVMGAAIARNFASRGLEVAVYDRSEAVRDRFEATWGGELLVVRDSPGALVTGMDRPRKILLLVPAGRAVDAVLEGLMPLLDEGDIVVDGGNSHFPDTARREKWAAEHSIRFFGMGVSGGEEGALHGPAMMPGGDKQAWAALRPLLESAAAQSEYGACVGYCGASGAGHFVKMVHNGIEYGDMQLIAEAWSAMRALGHDDAAIAAEFKRYGGTKLSSYLIEITADILASKDPNAGEDQGSGRLLVDAILDVAGQKGTGRWTSVAAIQLGVPIPTITAAVDARAMSARKADRVAAEAQFGKGDAPLAGIDLAAIERALLCAKLMSYTQGLELIRAGSEEHAFAIDRAEVARIWTGGCIIRAAFLGRVQQALAADPDLHLLFAAPEFATDVASGAVALRRVVAACATAGLAVPAMAASLSYFESMTAAVGTASLIQAQRDYFGAHTYRRREDPDTPVHTVWSHLSKLDG